MDKKLKELKNAYKNNPLPDELDDVVEKALKRKTNKSFRYSWLAGVAAAVVLFTVGLNTSTAMANALVNIPVIGNVVQVLTFKEFTLDENGHFHANIAVPEVTGLENNELTKSLNEKYLKEGQELYEQFMNDMEDIKAIGDGHFGVDSGYEIKTDNEQILSIGRYVVEVAGSATETKKYDTIDKKNQLLLSLPMLFKDDGYIQLISENVKQQMLTAAQEDPNKIYWLAGAGLSEEIADEAFETIQADQNFYINEDGKLVISFDEYEVAPGYMGVPEFVIPTDVISKALVSNEYIK